MSDNLKPATPIAPSPSDAAPCPALTPDKQDLWRSHLDQLRTNQAESAVLLDKLIVTLAGGALGISLTLVDNIASAVLKTTVWDLVIAWTFLCITLFIVLFSHWFSLQAHRRAIIHAQEKLAGHDVTKAPPDYGDWKTGLATLTAIITLGIGLFFLVTFFSHCLYRVAPNKHHIHYVHDLEKYPPAH